MHILQSRRVLLPVHYPSYPNGRGLSSISWSVFTKKIFKISKILYHFGRAVHFSWPKCHKKKPKIGRILPLRRADRGSCVRNGKEGLGRAHKLPAAGLKLAKSRRAPPPRRASFGGKGKKCLAPEICPAIHADHSEYLHILRQLRKLPKVKKVFIRSGIRFDYLLADPDDTFFRELVREHTSGQLKVAPEHCSNHVLDKMGKPHFEHYQAFQKRFYEITKSIGKEQYLVPYLMSSHPGSTLQDAIALAVYLKENHIHPEQVQDFYPTPGTISTCMYYTEYDPYTMEPVFVPKTEQEKAMQRALLQSFLPQNRPLVLAALRKAGRMDLVGNGVI